MDLFKNLKSINSIKQAYRKACFIYHPDKGGSTADMQALNAAYHTALLAADGYEDIGDDGKIHTYHYHRETEQSIIKKLYDLLCLKLHEAKDLDILIVGTWLWIGGDTRAYKDDLKKLGCKWHSKRLKWFWHAPTYKRRYNSEASFSRLCAIYGAKEFDSVQEFAPVPA